MNVGLLQKVQRSRRAGWFARSRALTFLLPDAQPRASILELDGDVPCQQEDMYRND